MIVSTSNPFPMHPPLCCTFPNAAQVLATADGFTASWLDVDGSRAETVVARMASPYTNYQCAVEELRLRFRIPVQAVAPIPDGQPTLEEVARHWRKVSSLKG